MFSFLKFPWGRMQCEKILGHLKLVCYSSCLVVYCTLEGDYFVFSKSRKSSGKAQLVITITNLSGRLQFEENEQIVLFANCVK